jgi:peroxiredoxin
MTHAAALLTAAVLLLGFAASLNLTFPLASDPGGKIQAQYGPGRIAFLIDKAGIVRLVVEGMPVNKKVLADIERLLK